MKLIKASFAIVFGLVIALSTSANIVAASDAGIQISPVSYSFDIDAGTSKTAELVVVNQTDTAVNYTTEIELFSRVSEEGAPSFQQAEKKEGVTSLADWINIESNKEGSIEVRGNVTLPFEIAVPVGADPGGHYAAIFVKQIIKNPEGKTELGVASRVGALVLLTVPGETNKSAEISGFSFPKFAWRGPVNLSLKVTNTGNTHYDSASQVSIKSIFGNTSTVDMGTHIVIPKNTRSYEGTWKNSYPSGYYKLTATAKDGDGKEITRTGTMYAIPLMLVIPVLVVLILVIIAIKYLRKHLKFTK